jgi:hypothetical protein
MKPSVILFAVSMMAVSAMGQTASALPKTKMEILEEKAELATARIKVNAEMKAAEIEASIKITEAKIKLINAKATLKSAHKSQRTIEVDSVKEHITVEGDNKAFETNTEHSSKTHEAGQLELSLAKVDADVAKTQAKASQPKIVSPCGWLGCYTPVGYGDSYYGDYGYGGGNYRSGGTRITSGGAGVGVNYSYYSGH